MASVNNSLGNLTSDNVYYLQYYCRKGDESEENEEFSKPLVWIGVYMALASLGCLAFMVADSLRSIRNDRYQITSKYFSLNVTSMMVITIAMKLLVDLSGSMPGNLDQVAKIGSIAFMCTILAILNPSLASMNNKTLRSNIIGLAIFVITIAVNLFIQIGTGVIKNYEGPLDIYLIKDGSPPKKLLTIVYSFTFVNMASAYIGIMIFLLFISISTAIFIPSIKKILEFKYQEKVKALNDEQKDTRITTVEELKQHVTKYWIMAKSGSPQFVMACNLLSYTSLLLCVAGMSVYAFVLTTLLKDDAVSGDYQSAYDWSIPVILITQFIGNVIGTVILISRGFTSMKFKVHDILRSNKFRIFVVRKEKYWTQRLCEWQGSHSHLGFLSSHHKLRICIHHIKKVALSLCIGLQFAFVQFNQLIASPFIFIMSCIIKFEDAWGYHVCSSTAPVSSKDDDDDINYEDLKTYVLQLEDHEVVQTSQKVIIQTMLKSMSRLIERAKKKQNNNLLELLGKYNDEFKGVEIFEKGDDSEKGDDIEKGDDVVQELLGKYDHLNLNSWSVPVVTLSCIAIAVPGISKDKVDSLIESIDNALLYTRCVEKSFNSARQYVDICKTATTLWYEVRDKRWWLENSIKKGVCGQLPRDILTSLADKAKVIFKEYENRTIEEHMIDFPNKLIAAHSMRRISKSILSKYEHEIETKERFFELLSSMIADILVACFSNIPQVIMMKCHHADKIEKREASVEAAVKLLGRSTEIIQNLEACKLPTPSMDPEKMGSIHEWRLHLKELKQLSFP